MIYPLARIFYMPFYNLWVKDVSGMQNLPKPPFIIAANHSSYYDTMLPYTLLIPRVNRQIHALVNSRYWDNFFFRIIVDWGKSIPVYVEKDQKSSEKNQQAMQKAAEFLQKGDLVQIFPEGSRSKDGMLKKGYTGAAKLALSAKVPILPFGIIDSTKVWPKGSVLPRFQRASVRIGKPLYFKEHYGEEEDKAVLEEMTRTLMKELGNLIGQEYLH